MSDENNATPPPVADVTREAEGQGWVPKDRFRGNEADWVDADVFVKRGREIMPILRKNNENLVRDLNATKQQLSEFREAAEEFKRFQHDSYKRKVDDYEVQIREIKESRAQAISDGDGTKVNALDDALDVAKEGFKDAKQAVSDAESKPKAAVAPVIAPIVEEWIARNDWFGKDKRMTGIANGIGDSLRLEYPKLTGEEFLSKLDDVLAEEFPTKFGGKKAAAGAASNRVESGSGRQGRVNAPPQSYDNLPSDAQKACDRFVKQKLMTREDYVRDFDWN